MSKIFSFSLLCIFNLITHILFLYKYLELNDGEGIFAWFIYSLVILISIGNIFGVIYFVRLMLVTKSDESKLQDSKQRIMEDLDKELAERKTRDYLERN